MKVKEMMSLNPACCTPNDTTESVAKMMCDLNIGSVPVVADQRSRALVGMITDRDLCCRVLAHGLDPKSTKIQEFVTYNPAICLDENVNNCERLMQEYQVRRIPVVDNENCLIGIVAQADLALIEDKPERVHRTVAEISKPTRPSIAA